MRSLFLLMLAAPVLPQEHGLVLPVHVQATTIDGREWYDVRARNASALGVVREIARASEREVYGIEVLPRPALMTVELRRRPLDQVLEYVLGSLGLRFELQHSSITVLEGRAETPEEALDEAAAAWMRVSRRFPDSPEAAEARLFMGEIAEARGQPSVARSTYLTLIEDYPTSSTVGEATMRAGRISASLGQWGEASRLFRNLANSDLAPEYNAAGRLEWARAMIAQGDPQAALYMLSALETNYPTTDEEQTTRRRLVRARALNETGRFMGALEEVGGPDSAYDSTDDWDALIVRAVALAGVGLPAEAARAWLLYASEAPGRDRDFAYREAARLSLAAEDELGALFVVRQAELAGAVEGMDPFEGIARQRLGLTTEEEDESVDARLARAEQWLEKGRTNDAAELLRPLLLSRGALEDDLGARICVGWAKCVEASAGLSAAIDVLRKTRETFELPEARQRIDRGAAELLERAGRFQDAIEAHQGRYPRP